MQPQQGSRIDLAELKAQIVKKIGADRSKKYFYSLNRFLSQKLSKSQFDQSCLRLLGRENLLLHNQLIRSILKNACQAKTPPPVQETVLAKSVNQALKGSPSREDGHEQSGSLTLNQNQNVPPIWSNGVLPVSPRKVRSGIRERKIRDRPPSLLGPNGKVCVSHQSVGTEDSGSRFHMENGDLITCDYQRPVQNHHAVAQQSENEKEESVQPTEKLRIPSKDQIGAAVFEDGDEVEQANQLNFSRSPLIAPLGIPFCSASVGGAQKPISTANAGDFVSCYDSFGLSDSETLRKRMEQIAAVQGLGGVSLECANKLNNMLDVYLKRLIRSCVELVGARSAQESRKHPVNKQQIPGRVINGMWPSNHLHMPTSSGHVEVMQDQRQRCSISLLDFKVAMDLNPQQLGEDWPLLLEKISMQWFKE